MNRYVGCRIISVIVLAMVITGCSDGSDAAPASEPSGRPTNPEPSATVLEGRTAAENPHRGPDGDLSAGPPNDRPVPRVVGAARDAACRQLTRNQYRGHVFSAEGAGDRTPQRVVEQFPEPGSRGAAVDAPVYLGVPGPLPKRLPAGTPCARRVIGDLPANFPTATDE